MTIDTLRPETAQASAVRPRGSRLAGIDAARGLAFLGMLAVHVGPEDVPTLAGRIYGLAHGRASILFVLIAGIGIALLSRREGSEGEARLRLATSALVLLPLGLALQIIGSPIAVILHHYAAFYLLGVLVLRLPQRALLVSAIAVTLIGPLIYFAIDATVPDLLGKPVSFLNNPVQVVSALLLTGPYPLIVWAAPVLWGVWLGRQDLRERRTQLMLLIGGAIVAVAASGLSAGLGAVVGVAENESDLRMLLSDTPHCEMPLWLLSALGSAACLLGFTILAADRFPRLFAPLAALGRIALTMYVAHILVFAGWQGVMHYDAIRPAIFAVIGFGAFGMLFASLWLARFTRGPIEHLMLMPYELMRWTLGPAASANTGTAEQPSLREASARG
jgi:uncharacterized membrane protein